VSITRPPRLLVITPTLGDSPWLAETIASVASHAGPRVLHVLVCPAGRVEGLARSHPGVRVVADSGRRGVYPAINDGWRALADKEWDWFTWLNDDDFLLPGFRSALSLASMPSMGRCPWIYGGIRLLGDDGRSLGSLAVCRREEDIGPLVDQGISPLNQQGMLIPREWLLELGGLREDLLICADFDLWLRALQAGARFCHAGAELAAFRLRPGQISGDEKRHRSEFLSVATRLRPRRSSLARRTLALLRFRLGNTPLYLRRLLLTRRLRGMALLRQEPTR